jgi:hypothetical protein
MSRLGWEKPSISSKVHLGCLIPSADLEPDETRTLPHAADGKAPGLESHLRLGKKR